MSRLPVAALCLGAIFLVGCPKVDPTPSSTNIGQGIIGKTTQDVGAYDANKANQVVSDQKIHASDPITAPLSAYGPMVESAAKSQITHALDLFNANENRYPNSHEEFMERIIKENNIKLPVPPYQGRYVYDVEKHQLMVVRDSENAEKASP
jgi:hypothetical protein